MEPVSSSHIQPPYLSPQEMVFLPGSKKLDTKKNLKILSQKIKTLLSKKQLLGPLPKLFTAITKGDFASIPFILAPRFIFSPTLKSPSTNLFPSPKNVRQLKITPERQLLCIANIFFSIMDTLQITQMLSENHNTLCSSVQKINENQDKISNYYSKIKGMEIYTNGQSLPLDCKCENYVFGEEIWKNYISTLSSFPPSLIQDFIDKNSRLQKVRKLPQVGDLAIYHFASIQARHIGIVHTIEEEQVWIRSKFGSSHIYCHLLENVPFYYGDRVTFYRYTKS